MIKKLNFFLVILIAIIAFAGCGSSPTNNDQVKEEIKQLTIDFESAVEAYDVAGMLGCLSGDGFTLTIQEAGHSYPPKAYDTLETELQNDETNQLEWRKPVSEGGYAYVLDLVLGAPEFDNVTSTGGIVTRTFDVLESAAEINEIKTDNGVIIWEVAQNSGEWKATKMTIEYQPLTAAGLFRQNGKRGFGFTTFNFPR